MRAIALDAIKGGIELGTGEIEYVEGMTVCNILGAMYAENIVCGGHGSSRFASAVQRDLLMPKGLNAIDLYRGAITINNINYPCTKKGCRHWIGPKMPHKWWLLAPTQDEAVTKHWQDRHEQQEQKRLKRQEQQRLKRQHEQQEREERQRLKALKQQERQEQQEEQRLKNLCSAQQLQWGREWLEQQRLKKEQQRFKEVQEAAQKKKEDDARLKEKNNKKKRKRAENKQKRQEKQRLKQQKREEQQRLKKRRLQEQQEEEQRRKQAKMLEAKANVLCGQPNLCSEDGCSDLQQMCGLCWPHYLIRR